jgi:hypothetical protein
MDLEKMAASIRQQFPIYENAGLEILQADEVFKARVILGEKTQNHVHMMHAAFLFWAVNFWAVWCRCAISSIRRNSSLSCEI